MQIVSHEEEHQRMAAIEHGQIIQDTPHDEEDHDESDDEHLEG